MTRPEALAFISAGTRIGKLATVRPDGRPHVVPIWFVVDGDDLVFNTWHRSVKALSLAQDPRAALAVDIEEPPYAYVLVEGSVSISEDPVQRREFVTRIGGRYMGEARAQEFGARNAVPGELLVRLHIESIVATDDVSG